MTVNTALLDELEGKKADFVGPPTPTPQDFLFPAPPKTTGINIELLDSVEAGEHKEVQESKAVVPAPGPAGLSIPEIADPSGLPTREYDPIKFGESVKEEFTRPAKGAQYIPGLGGIVGSAEQLLYLDAAQRLRGGFDYSKPTRPGELVAGAQGYRPPAYATKEADTKLIEDLILRTQQQQERGYSFGGMVAKGLLNLPTWMAEFAMTGGLASLGSTAAKEAGVKIMGRYAKTKVGQIALKGMGWTGGAITRATLGLTPRITEKALGRQVNVQILGADQEGWATSFAKAWGDITIEAASETAGQAITAFPVKLLNKTKFGSKFLNALRSGWMKATGGKAAMFAKKMAEKGGYSNLIGEYGEERLGSLLRALTAVDDFGAGKDANVVERLKAAAKQDFEPMNIAVELTVLSAIPGAQVAIGTVARVLGREREVEGKPAAEVTPEKRQQAIDYVKGILSQEQYADLDEKAKSEIGQRMLAEQGMEVEAEELAAEVTEEYENEGMRIISEISKKIQEGAQTPEELDALRAEGLRRAEELAEKPPTVPIAAPEPTPTGRKVGEAVEVPENTPDAAARLLKRIEEDGAGNKITDKLIDDVFDKASEKQLADPQSLLGPIREILGNKVFDSMFPYESKLLNQFTKAKARNKSLTLSQFLTKRLEKPVAIRKAEIAPVTQPEGGEVIEYARRADGTLKTKKDYTEQEWRDYTKSVITAKPESEKIIHKIRKMTPEELAEDEAFWANIGEIKKAVHVPTIEALSDTLSKRLDLLQKVQFGILTQEEADALTRKFAEATKLRIEAKPEAEQKPLTPKVKEKPPVVEVILSPALQYQRDYREFLRDKSRIVKRPEPPTGLSVGESNTIRERVEREEREKAEKPPLGDIVIKSRRTGQEVDRIKVEKEVESVKDKMLRSKYSSDVIGDMVEPTPTSGIKNIGPGKIQHVQGDISLPNELKIKVEGYGGPHWYTKDFQFIEKPEKTLAPKAKEDVEYIEDKHEQAEAQEEGRPGRVREEGRKPLEAVPPKVVPTPEKEGGAVRPTVRGGGEGARVYGPAGEPAGIQSGDRLSSSEGSSTKDVDTSTRRGPTTRQPTTDTAKADYRITEADEIGKGGAKTKYRNNIAAIKLLKEIEGRQATPEEQAVLVKYVGWGGMPQVFSQWDDKWTREFKALKELLTEEEYDAAKASTPNAHYTSFDTISAMWEGLAKLGFKGGKINEPSMGVGHFFGLMPDSIAGMSKLSGVELDVISGKIAQQLYQSADIRIKGFEKVKYADDSFDLFISNVPFGDYRVYDPDLRKLKFRIHDFFFAKALKKTRPDGLVAFITSRYTMDKRDSSIRLYLSKYADLVGAIRLPNTAFKENANTEVVTDILIFQKRDPKNFKAGEEYQNIGEIAVGDETFNINEYFVKNPKHILGKMAYTGSMYGGQEFTVEPKSSIKLNEAIPEIMATFAVPHNIDKVTETTAERDEPGYSAPAPDHIKEGAYVYQEGRLLKNDGGELRVVVEKLAVKKRIRDLMSVRDALRDLIHKQLNPAATEVEIKQARKKLNTVYKATVKKHGPLSKPYNERIFRDDPDLPMLLSLETYDRKAKSVVKLADIFTKRTQYPYKVVERVENADEALIASLTEKGGVDLEYMAIIADRSHDDIINELAGKIYMDPVKMKYEPAELYLAGNVREKLQAAKDAKLYRNFEALEKVQPEDILPLDIDARLGVGWVEENDYKDFYEHLTGSAYNFAVRKIESEGTWVMQGYASRGTGETVDWGTDRFGASKLMVLAMNQKEPTAYDKTREGGKAVNQDETIAARVKQQKIKDEFKRWIWDDVARAKRLARKYNDMFNNVVFPVWDGSHLRLPGKVDDSIIKMRPHQNNAVWRFLTSGNTLMAHAVGAGKTYTGVAMAMEGRRLGLINKPIFVVPNHLVTQWRDAWMELYPSATILFATEEDFVPKKRKTLMNKIATGDWDGIIVPMTSFEKIPMHPDIVREFFNEQIVELEIEIQTAHGEDKNLVKQMEKAKKRLQESLERQEAKWKKDVGPYFNEMGIDMLFVDEAQEFKNLFFRTQMTRVAGVSQQFVQKSFDMEMKSKYVNKISGNKGIVFATGTPITNSISEMYTMQKYLQPDLLKKAEVAAFDFWAQNFGETVTAVEVAPDGSGFRVHTRFAKFSNVPELMQMFRMTADIQTQKTLGLKLPKVKGGKAQIMTAPGSPILKSYVETLVERAKNIRSGHVDPRDDNMLKVVGDGRKAALDMRLVDSTASDMPTSKVNMLVDKVYEIWESTAGERATQVIWCDLSTPASGGWSIYHDIKDKLIKKGIPAGEVAFIHDVKNKKNLSTFYRKVNDGEIRVVIASTAKMSTGANVQQRLIAAHHLDAPWRPADVEQRDGRIIRQGNSYDEVEIFRYITKGSFDAYMWQTLETKAKFIAQVMTGETTAREIEDIGDTILSYAEIKALASGNPKVMQAVQLESDIQKLQALERAHRNQQYSLKNKSAWLPGRIKRHTESAKNAEKDSAKYKKAKEAAGDEIDFTIKGTKYTTRKDAGEALLVALGEFNKLTNKETNIGSAYGFPLTTTWNKGFDTFDVKLFNKWEKEGQQGEFDDYADKHPGESGWMRVTIKGLGHYQTDMETSAAGNITRIINTFDSIFQLSSENAAQAKGEQKELEDITSKLDAPFEEDKELKEKKELLTRIQQELDLDRKDVVIAEEEKPPEEPPGEEPQIDIESPMAGFAGVGRPAPAKVKVSAIISEDMKTGSEAADSFILRSKGFTKSGSPNLARRMVGWIAETVKGFHYLPWLPKTTEFADVREHFRHTQEIAKRAWESAAESMRWALEPIKGVKTEVRKRLRAVEMKIIADDLAEDVASGTILPPGLEPIDVEMMKARADELYDLYPSVQESYDRLRQVTREVGDMLVAEGMLKREQAKDFYFPHKVIKYLRKEDGFWGIPSKKPAEYKKGYLRQRKGGHDYSTDIMERLVEHWAAVQRDVAYRQFLESVLKNEQRDYFKKEYPGWKEFTIDEDTGKKVHHLVPDGYKEVSVLPGRYYYSTYGVTEDMAKAIVEQNLVSIEDLFDEDTASQIRKVIALGRKRSYIVREPIARQLTDMPTRPISSNSAYLVVKGFNTFVKRQILFNPLYTVPFHVQNFIGDATKVAVVLPSALKSKYLVHYWQEIISAHKGEKSERFEGAQKYGVVGAGWIGVEVQELKTLLPEISKAEISGASKAVSQKARILWNLARKFGVGREDWLRYALFDRLLDLQEQGQDISKYAIKDSATIKGISDPMAAAAKVARDLAGDYGAVGRTGQMLSDLFVPFYRWMHLNLPWWPRMVKEYAKKGQYGRLAQALSAAAFPYIAAMLWNYSDDERRKFEQSLPPWKRWNFHINSLHGKKMYYVQLPLDDILNFIGVPEDILDYQRYQRGMINGPELIKRIVINSTYEPGMSIVNSVGGLAAVVRDAIGWQTFPDWKDYRITDWKRKGLNIGSDIFGAPGQLGKQLMREGVNIDPDTGEIILGPKTKDTLNRAWMGIRPYSVDVGQTETLLKKSTYKRTKRSYVSPSGKKYPQIKGEAHKGKERLVDSLNIQLEKRD